MIIRDDIPVGSTYDSNGNELTFKDADGYWEECTYDLNGNVLTFKDSTGANYDYSREHSRRIYF